MSRLCCARILVYLRWFADYSAYTATSDAHATAHGPNTPQTDLLGHRTIRETTKRPDAPQLQRQRQSDVVGTARSDRTEKYASHAARSRPEDSNARGWVCPGPLGGLTDAALARVRISVFESCSHRHRRAAHAAHATRTLRTAAHNAGRADAAAADAPESAPVSRVSTWHEASVVRCRAWRGWGSGTPCHDEEAVAAVVEELPRHLRHSGVRSRASLHSWRAKQVFLAHFLPMRCGHWQSGCSPGGSEPSKLSCAAAHENSCAAAHDL